ncbi:hypothetical protein ONZ45_g14328 [Pleurotus djamor]|nr:hypothetical protein ONZ45_g14328 [Pleurotus djamor]
MPINFPFTFSFNVPGLTNPFTPPLPPPSRPVPTNDEDRIRNRNTDPLPTQRVNSQRRRPNPSPPAPPLSRKRGWDPAFASPSQSATTLASTSGYLDTPAKYRAMATNPQASTSRDELHEIEYVDEADAAELPPAKRRRGLAGTIVSTALSAALIGTAVGLTVYRLVAGPPLNSCPKNPSDRNPRNQPPSSKPLPPLLAARLGMLPDPRTSATHTRIVHAPDRRVQHAFAPIASSSRTHGLTAPPPPEFDFSHAEASEDPVDEQMDWIGDKVARLIEEGKRALGKEVVVMSDAKEDEEDDGSGAWEEEDQCPPSPTRHSLSRRNSQRQMKPPAALQFTRSPPPSYSPPTIAAVSSAPYYATQFEPSSFKSTHSLPQTPPARHSHVRGVSVDAELGFNSRGLREDEASWESPELRESMSRARARFAARSFNGGT